ncbi:hypothetical protein ATE92_2086 [Ulvibacter sp. MAR_2010_11]|uniref:sensor of ECF-type sigma factor n=1 Tax=Ulvibacter sp. MAR_2010_11 TaxID=1250229 RepID=UPI000C2BF5B4|nr:sensor of ECF-type sigma factor [Ulvibacter sp. MAR_2010_11]PKA83917.1 hypothetical protein ATE92_2086 [Ulvibacter sp. MAR_2010_11]
MKKLLLLVLFIGVAAGAQENKHEKIKALKRAHITEVLALSTAEAEKFWPVYKVYEDKMDVMRRSERKELGVFKRDSLESLTDAEANTLIDKLLEIKSKELEYRRELILELRKVISPKKVLKLKKAEEEFKRELLKQYRNRKGKE